MRTFPPKRTFPLLKAILGRVQTFQAVTEENRAIFGVDRILARDRGETIWFDTDGRHHRICLAHRSRIDFAKGIHPTSIGDVLDGFHFSICRLHIQARIVRRATTSQNRTLGLCFMSDRCHVTILRHCLGDSTLEPFSVFRPNGSKLSNCFAKVELSSCDV
jgi:hypothetical protein